MILLTDFSSAISEIEREFPDLKCSVETWMPEEAEREKWEAEAAPTDHTHHISPPMQDLAPEKTVHVERVRATPVGGVAVVAWKRRRHLLRDAWAVG